MKRFAGLIAALALAASMTACGDGGKESETTPVAVVGPVTGQYASSARRCRMAAQMRRRRHQRRRRRARPEARSRSRRRCLRSEAGGLRRQPAGRPTAWRSWPGISARARRSRRAMSMPSERAADVARLDQSRLHRRTPGEHLPRLRPRRPAGRLAGKYLAAHSPTRTSRSSTTRRPTARAWRTRPRRR